MLIRFYFEFVFFFGKMETNEQHYFKLYKPYGYVSQFITNDSKAKRKKFLGDLYDFPEGTMAVGRLDEKSEGLLLLTTDGKFSYHITTSGIEKEYFVQVDGEITKEAVLQLRQGVEIGINGNKYLTKPCAAVKIKPPPLPTTQQRIRDDRHGPSSWVSVTLTEGKFRQVRKMTAAVGFPTLRLVRVRIGDYHLHAMLPKQVIKISKS